MSGLEVTENERRSTEGKEIEDARRAGQIVERGEVSNRHLPPGDESGGKNKERR